MAASDISRHNGWTNTNGLRTPHRKTEVPCALFHRSCGQDVGQLITKPMTNWTRASTTMKEHAVSKTHRESVSDAAQLQKEDPSVAQLVAAQNDDVITAKSGNFARSEARNDEMELISVSSCVEGRNCMVLKR